MHKGKVLKQAIKLIYPITFMLFPLLDISNLRL